MLFFKAQSFQSPVISNMHLKFYIAIQSDVNLKIEITISRDRDVLFENGKKYVKIQLEP